MPGALCHTPGITGLGKKGTITSKILNVFQMGTQKIQGNICRNFTDLPGSVHLVFKSITQIKPQSLLIIVLQHSNVDQF